MSKDIPILAKEKETALFLRRLFFHVSMMQAYMVELYQDSLVDLLLPKNVKRPKKLDIKKDSKVIITAIVIFYL